MSHTFGAADMVRGKLWDGIKKKILKVGTVLDRQPYATEIGPRPGHANGSTTAVCQGASSFFV